MKSYLTLLRYATAAALVGLGVQSIFAQAAPAATPGSEPDAVKLDPFNVSAASDVGFVAASSLAGGRMATALKDTPVAYSVLTSEFLEAFNINDAGKAAEFSVNTTQFTSDGTNGTNGPTQVVVRIRGQPANTPAHNFFPYNIAADSYNVDRIDFARGANASLFGAGGSAGTQNTVTKQALTTKTIREVRAQVGSYQKYRLTMDLNQPLNAKTAVRANVLWSTGDTWRQREWEDRKGVHLAATYNLTSKFTVRGEFEFRTTDRAAGNNHSRDNTSAWDGKFTPSGINLSMTAAQMAVAGVQRSPRRFVRDADRPDQIYNVLNMFQTKGAAYNATTTNYLNGKPIRSVGFNLSNTGMTDTWDVPDRFAAAYAGSPFFTVPARNFTPLWDVDRKFPVGWERAKDLAVYFAYRPFEGFFAELSGNWNKVERWTEYTATGGMYNMLLDINRNKPDGTPNPYFLHPYSDNSGFSFVKAPEYNNANLQVAYVKDTRWGKLQLGVLGGVQYQDQVNRQFFYILPLQNGVLPGADFRSFFGQADQNAQSVYTRQYTDLRGKLPSRHPTETPMTVYDPTLGTRATLTPHWYVQPSRPGFTDDLSKKYKFVQAAANLNLFKNRLVLIGAVRRDLTRLVDDQFLLADDMPVGWDGSHVSFRPKAPKDYYTLFYTPKDATGKAISTPIPAATRPRSAVNGVNVPLAQYANDRFQDDTSPPDVVSGVNTRTYGAVINLTSWFGVYANNSTTFDLNAGNLNAYVQLIPPTSSQSYDAGIRFSQPNGKMYFSLGWYKAHQQGQLNSVGFSFMANVNRIASAPQVGNLSEDAGGNVRGLAVLPGRDVYSTLTSETMGYEAELTANLTRNWRLIINAANNKPVQKDAWPELPGWVAEKDALLRQILADTGIILNAQDQASINPALDDPTKINQNRVAGVVSAWNSYVNTTLPGIKATTTQPFRQSGGPALTANIATDYRFTTGFVRGLRAGFALNYRGRQVLGGRTADTIPDPNNPTVAIPDPTRGATNYVFAGGYGKASANLSYTVRLKEGRHRFAPQTVQFDLAIDNLFDMSKPIIENAPNSTSNSTVTVARNNDISNPGIMTIPGTYNYTTPRNYVLTAKMNF